MTYRIESLPNDDVVRVVWMLGAVIVSDNKSEQPHIIVALKRQMPNGVLEEGYTNFKVALAQADILRIGTVWQGQTRADKVWTNYAKDYDQGIQFDFNFDDFPPRSVGLSETKPENDHYYIPPYVYPLTNPNKRSFTQIAKSKLTRLISVDEYTVLIPAIEMLTSCYTPKEQQIRNDLVNRPLQEALGRFIDVNESIENNLGGYDLYLKKPKHPTNTTFLAYACLNKISKARISALKSSLSVANKDSSGRNYPDRYPDVLPYHPHRLTIICDGVWIDDYTFLALRVNNYSLPVEIDLNAYILEYLSEDRVGANSRGTKGKDDSQEPIVGSGGIPPNPQSLPIKSGVDPGNNAGSVNMTSEVMLCGQLPQIDSFIEERNADGGSGNKKSNWKQVEVDGVSSGHTNGTEDSKQTAQLRQDESDDGSNEGVNQLEILELVNNALVNLLLEGKVESMSYFDQFGSVYDQTYYGSFPVKLLNTNNSYSWVVARWVSSDEVVTRAFLLAKLVVTGKVVYLLEIQRKTDSEAFSGLIFQLDNEEGVPNKIYSLLEAVVKYQGKFRYRIKPSNSNKEKERLEKSKRNPLPECIARSVLFGHRKGKKSWEDKIFSELQNALNKFGKN